MEYRKHANHCVYDLGPAPLESFEGPITGVRPHTVIDAMAGAVARAFAAAQAKMRERATIREISNLDDHILNDIGLPRSEIRAMARKLAENPGLDHRSLRA